MRQCDEKMSLSMGQGRRMLYVNTLPILELRARCEYHRSRATLDECRARFMADVKKYEGGV